MHVSSMCHVGVVLQEVRGGFERLKKAVRAGSKANQSHHSAPSLDVSSSVNSTPHHPHTHLLSLSGGLTPQSSIQPSQLENTLSRFSVQRLQSETSYGPTSQSGTVCPISQFMVNCFMHVHVHVCMINKARQGYTPRSLFSKKKLPWVGFEPTTLRILGERSTN